MTVEVIDAWSRRLATLFSRQSLLRAGVAATAAGMASLTPPERIAGRHRKRKRRRKRRRPCQNACCRDADCGPLKLCAGGQCVIGQGTCPASTQSCTGAAPICGTALQECACFRSTVGAVRCGANQILPGAVCGGCVNDLDCAANHPDILGIFCTQGGASCSCVGLSFCQAPCPLESP
jgi:hypothetical protein